MTKKITDEMKRFVSTQHEEGKDRTEILREFGDKFGFLPTSPTIGKYEKYNKDNPIKEEEEEEEAGGDDEGSVTVETKDTRLEKDLVDISDGIDEAEFERLCRNCDKSKTVMFDLLKRAVSKGYTKVNIATGELEK